MGRLRRPELPPSALADLLRELHALHARAGKPSMRDLAKGQRFSYTAVHDLFTKTTAEPPKLPVLLAVVEQLATLAPRGNVEEILDRFDALWQAADAEPFERPVGDALVAAAPTVHVPLRKEPATSDATVDREPEQLTREEKAVLEQMAQHKTQQQIRAALNDMPLQHYSRVEGNLYDKLSVSDGGRPDLLKRAQELGLLAPEPRAEEPGMPVGRAMTKELFFLAGSAAPLHHAAAELRRAGYLVRDQPRDLDGTWSLMAYSAASELTDDDLATLDGVAELCGVDFDGWGTYAGPPELDDGPGKPPTSTRPSREPLTRTGRVVAAAPVVDRVLTGHTSVVYAMAVAQLGERPVVVSSSLDATVRVWDLDTGEPVWSPFTGHTRVVRAVAVGQRGGHPVVVEAHRVQWRLGSPEIGSSRAGW